MAYSSGGIHQFGIAERDLREAEGVGMRWRSCPGRAYYLKSGLAANNWSKQ